MQKAIQAVVHHDTLEEWKEAGLDYPLSPEDQAGVRFKMATTHSPYREVAVDQMWRKKIGGQEVLVAHVIEWAEDERHKRLAWDYLVGKRRSTEFEYDWDGNQYSRAVPVNSEDVFTVLFSKQEVEKILRAHNTSGRTKFYIDADYTTLTVHVESDFFDMTYEQLHDKYIRGSTLIPGMKYTPPAASYPGTIKPIQPITSGFSNISGKQLAIMMSVEGGQELGQQILGHIAAQDPERARQMSIEARDYIQDMINKQQNTATFALKGDPNSGAVFNEPMPVREQVGFVTTKHDESGNPVKEIHQDSDGRYFERPIKRGRGRPRKDSYGPPQMQSTEAEEEEDRLREEGQEEEEEAGELEEQEEQQENVENTEPAAATAP